MKTLDTARAIREHYRETAETLTFTSGKHGTTWTAAPGYGACIYQTTAGTYTATVGEIWKPSTFDAVVLINQTRRKFVTREEARSWAREQAAAHGYPEQTARPAFDLFTI